MPASTLPVPELPNAIAVLHHWLIPRRSLATNSHPPNAKTTSPQTDPNCGTLAHVVPPRFPSLSFQIRPSKKSGVTDSGCCKIASRADSSFLIAKLGRFADLILRLSPF